MSETAELITQEVIKSPEQEFFSSEYDALHIRLLLGGKALNPDNYQLPQVDKTQIKDFEERRENYQVFNEASTKERQKLVATSEEKLEQAITDWIIGTKDKKGMRELLTQDFDKYFEAEKAKRWRTTLNQFLKHLGIEDISQATKDDIRQKIYDRYFTGKNKRSNIYQFVLDVLISQNHDFSAIKNNIDVYQWFAGIFGVNSQQLVAHLIAAEAEYQQDPDVLIAKANADTDKKDDKGQPIGRINVLNEKEKEVLRFVWQKEEDTSKDEGESQEENETSIVVEGEDQEEEKSDLQKEVADLKKELEKKAAEKEDGILRAITSTTGNDMYIYQQIICHENFRMRDASGKDIYWRGYLMVEEEDIPQAVRLLLKIASTRTKKGLPTKFKWLVGYKNPDDEIDEHIGDYSMLDDEVGRVVIYGQTQEEIKEILTALSQLSEWQEIEKRRRDNRPVRRPGTSALELEINGKKEEFRTLCYGEAQGFSEYAAVDPLWRFTRKGYFTQVLLSPEQIREDAKKAQKRLSEIYNLDKEILLRSRFLFIEKINEISERDGKRNGIIRPTERDITDLIQSIKNEPAFNTHISEIRKIYPGMTDDQLIAEFINDMNLLRLQN